MKIKKILLLIGFLSLTLLVNITFTSSVFAQASNPFSLPLTSNKNNTSKLDLTISPNFINLKTDPGIAVSSKFEIANNSNLREYLKITLVKFKANKSGDKPMYDAITLDDKFPKWISLSENQFVIGPNEHKTIKVTVAPTLDAGLGYYYGAQIERVEGSIPNQDPLPTILILLEVTSEQAKKELNLVNLKTSKIFYEYLPAEFEIKLKNSGNVHIIPSGDLFINSWNKKTVATIPINQSRGNVLPGTTRTFNISWHISNKIKIGRFTAHLLAVYDNGQENIPIESTVSFWVIPWKILLITLVGLAISIVGIKLLLKNIKNRRKK